MPARGRQARHRDREQGALYAIVANSGLGGPNEPGPDDLSEPEDVAGTVAWLLSGDARGVTRQGIDQNGGAFMI